LKYDLEIVCGPTDERAWACNGPCKIFRGTNIPKRKKYTKSPQTTPNNQTLYTMAVNYTKRP
jgi:hypothetical protein